MSMCRAVSWVVGTGGLLWPVCSLDKNSASLCPASFCTPRPNLPVVPGIPWLPTFAFQSSRWRTRGTRDQIANIHWIMEKAREFQKNIYFCFIEYAKAFDCVDHNKLWKFLQEIGTPDHLTWLLRSLYAGQKATVRTGHGTTDCQNQERSTSRLNTVTQLI